MGIYGYPGLNSQGGTDILQSPCLHTSSPTNPTNRSKRQIANIEFVESSSFWGAAGSSLDRINP